MPMRVLVVANPEPTQMGAHLLEAARTLGLDVAVCDTREAYRAPLIMRQVAWRLAGHRPARLREFGARVLATVRSWRPDVVLTTGLAPVPEAVLESIGAAGVRRFNFLTDDPWNPAHRAPWFLRTLRRYDVIFSPRRANLDDLRRAGAARVEYLRFGYSPSAHRRESPETADERQRYRADVLLAGGADEDRVKLVAPLVQAGVSVALYGGYWTRFAETRAHARGMLAPDGLRKATTTAAVCLGLVRRANRDGHSMRTFEVPAMSGCLLAEWTPDHAELFGNDGDAVTYFREPGDLVDRVRWILDRPAERDRLTARAHALITGGRHTYADRLAAMLEAA